ncbi:MAG: hypothetical protein Q9160_008140 [Pyrenula sp. 1 TL-2023]
MQLLLGPDEHARYFQEAVAKFDIINPKTGVTFPKTIPRDAFPEKPDDEMCRWHNMMGRRLEQESKRIQAASPMLSPRGDRTSGHEARNAETEYFPRSPNRAQHKHRPSRPSRSSSHDQRKTSNSSSRRSSLPDQTASSWPPGSEHSVHFAHDSIPPKPKSPHDPSLGHKTSNSSGNSQSRHRTSNASSHHRPSSSSNSRPSLSLATDPPHPVHPAHRNERASRDQGHRHRTPASVGTRVRPRSPTLTVSSSGSAASSEDSLGPRAGNRRGRKRENLFPPNSLTNTVKKGLHHLRRHSHDATYRFTKNVTGGATEPVPPLPPRPNVRQAYEVDKERAPAPPTSGYAHRTQHALPDPRSSNAQQVKFHDRIFQQESGERGNNGGHNSGPESPGTKVPHTKPRFRYTDSQGRETFPTPRGPASVPRKSSESETDWGMRQRPRKYEGPPARSKTMAGANSKGGRKYPSAESGIGDRFFTE